MRKIMRATIWVILNCTLIGATIAGTIFNIGPAWNLARFSIVLFAIVTTLAVAHVETANAIAAQGRAVPAWLSVAFDVVTVCILAATGHFVFAAIQAWQAMIEPALWIKPIEKP